jgi:glucosamine 6-phosphate synthetase-like amidotransferase/phosphosugar isomerase protein
VIAQFLGLQIRNGKTMVEALEFFSSKAELKASQWGLVIVDREQPDKIYTFTHGSPLLIGFSPF